MLGLRRLQRSYPIPVYMAYIWLGAGTVIGAIFEPLKLLALSGIAAGVTLVVEVGRGESQKESGRHRVMWQLFAVLCFTLLFGCVRMAMASGADARVVTALVMLTAGMLYVASAIRNRQSLYPSNDRPMILLTIAASAIGNIAFFTSLASAPNLAYTDTIINLRLVILYVITLMMGADRLDAVKALGVALTFGCAPLLS